MRPKLYITANKNTYRSTSSHELNGLQVFVSPCRIEFLMFIGQVFNRAFMNTSQQSQSLAITTGVNSYSQ